MTKREKIVFYGITAVLIAVLIYGYLVGAR